MQTHLSRFVRKLLSCNCRLFLIQQKVKARGNTHFPELFQHYVHEKRPRRIASSRFFFMRLRIAVFAKNRMNGCAVGHLGHSHSANRNKNQSIRGLRSIKMPFLRGGIPHVSDMQIHSGIKLVSIRYWHFRRQTVYYSTLNNDTCPTHPKCVALEWFTILQANGDLRLAVSAKPVIRKLNLIIAVLNPFNKDVVKTMPLCIVAL